MPHTSTEILFDKFEVIACLKKDAHTSVYLANHIYLGKKIILKTLDTDNLSDKTILERFKREAKILARLDHPNLIKVLDFGTYSHHFYISFEYFESRNLREVIKNNNLSVEEKNQIIIQLLKALNIAHQTQIVHRDIKPENILVNENLELKIADFGLALIQDDTSLTQKSSIVGTPSYMSPEQIRGESLTPQSDLFSAGIVCYELFTGKNPLIGKDLSETINKILNFDEARLLELEVLPDPARLVIRSMLKKNKAARLKNASDGLSMFGINATVYDLPKDDIELTFFRKKNNLLLIGIPLVIILLISLWMFARNSSFINPASVEPLVQTDSTFINTPDQDQIAANTEEESPVETKKEIKGGEEESFIALPGMMKIEVFPWAYVEIDGKDLGATPLKEPVSLPAGRHTIKLSHPDFPVYTRRLRVRPGEQQSLKINFNELVGYLECKVEPWGDVYINNVFKGTTPIKPIVLLPGSYLLTVTNPAFGRSEKRIRISEKETTTFELNFKSELK